MSKKTTCMNKVRRNMFIIYAVTSAMCFGVHNYLVALSMHNWRNSIDVLYPEGIPLVLAHVIYHAYQAYVVVKPNTGGLLWTKSRSMFYNSNGEFKQKPLILAMA